MQTLRDTGRRPGFVVKTLPDVTDQVDYHISTSEVRTALAIGDLPHAGLLLGQPYAISSHRHPRPELDRTPGYPNLNLVVEQRCAARSGIYVAVVHGPGHVPHYREQRLKCCSSRIYLIYRHPLTLTVNSCVFNSRIMCETKKNSPI